MTQKTLNFQSYTCGLQGFLKATTLVKSVNNITQHNNYMVLRNFLLILMGEHAEEY